MDSYRCFGARRFNALARSLQARSGGVSLRLQGGHAEVSASSTHGKIALPPETVTIIAHPYCSAEALVTRLARVERAACGTRYIATAQNDFTTFACNSSQDLVPVNEHICFRRRDSYSTVDFGDQVSDHLQTGHQEIFHLRLLLSVFCESFLRAWVGKPRPKCPCMGSRPDRREDF